MGRFTNARDRIRNTPGLTRDIGLVAAMVVIGLVTTGILVAHYQVIRPGADRYVFSAVFDQAPAIQLASRQEVRIAGVTVGRITAAKPSEDGHAELTMSLEPGHPVYRNARLILRSKSPINIIYVALDPGDPSAGKLPEDGTIPMAQTDRVTQPYELLDQLDSRARLALTDLVNEADVALTSAPANLPGGLAATDRTAQSFQPVVDALQTRRENLRRLVTSVARISSAAGADDERLSDLAGALRTTLGVLASHDQELGRTLDQLPGVTRTLRSSLASATALTRELSPTLDQLTRASGRLPGAVTRLTSTVENARDVFATAGPVITKARPVLADLRPLVGNLDAALADLRPVTANLPQATAKLVPWLGNLGAFVYNTSSSFSLGDVNGGAGRANVVVKVLEPLGAPLGAS